MSELINNSDKRKELLKNMMHHLNKGEAPEMVREQMARVMGEVPTTRCAISKPAASVFSSATERHNTTP